MNWKHTIHNLKIKLKQLPFKKITFFILSLLFISFLALRLSITKHIPSKKELSNINNPLASSLYSEDGQLIGQYYVENRSYLQSDDLNEFYRNALIATEDIRFYKHGGVDYKSLLRVFFKTILMQDASNGGGSTLTQQLAKNLYPREAYSVFSTARNKLREMVIARKLEDIYNKEELLLLYSNTVPFGEKAFGLGTASKRFFNKAPKDLLPEEAAVLVGLLKATSYYSPRINPDNATKRRNTVLNKMVKYDFISAETGKQLTALPLTLDYKTPINKLEFAPYFKSHVKNEFEQWSQQNSKPNGAKYDILRDGLKIYTTIDHEFQIAAEEVMKSHMKKLQKLFNNSWKTGNKFGKTTRVIDDQITKNSEYKSLRASGKSGSEALTAFTTKDNRTLWDWTGTHEKDITKIDSIKHYLSLLHTGILAADPATGNIKAWVGGINYSKFKNDNILRKRQPGSTFKPLVYLAALESGIEPCDEYENKTITYKSYQNWTPKNANNKYGGKLSVQNALAGSVNTVSVQVLFDTGLPKVIETSHKLGINSELKEVPSIVLGTSDVSLFEMVGAYSVFANEGKQVPLKAISLIKDAEGNILYRKDIEPRKVISSRPVQQLNGMLQMVTKEGTGKRLYEKYKIDFPVMGKTGTTQNQSDGWFIAYNKYLVVGAWVGANDRRIHFKNLATGSGSRTALPMVASLFEFANTEEKMSYKSFPEYQLAYCEDDIYKEDYLYDDSNYYNIGRSSIPSTSKRRERDRHYETYQQRIDSYRREREKRRKEYEKARRKWKQRFDSLRKNRRKYN